MNFISRFCLIVVMLATAMYAQNRPRPEFEVASVRVNDPTNNQTSYMPTLDIRPGGTLRISNRRLDEIIMLAYGIGRLTKSRTTADIALHATESVILASVASQVIRGPLGRTRPHVTNDSNQYHFQPFKGFRNFKNRAFRILRGKLQKLLDKARCDRKLMHGDTSFLPSPLSSP